jgi:hypothetical protein
MEYTYIHGDRVHFDWQFFNNSWEVTNPNGGAIELTADDMPMTATYCPRDRGMIRVENSRHSFFLPTAAITSFERAEPQQKVMVLKMKSNSLNQWLVATDRRQLLDNLETFYPHEIPFGEYRPGETLTIEFAEMTQEELDKLPAFDGF